MKMQILGNFGEFWGIHMLGNILGKDNTEMFGECIRNFHSMSDDTYSQLFGYPLFQRRLFTNEFLNVIHPSTPTPSPHASPTNHPFGEFFF